MARKCLISDLGCLLSLVCSSKLFTGCFYVSGNRSALIIQFLIGIDFLKKYVFSKSCNLERRKSDIYTSDISHSKNLPLEKITPCFTLIIMPSHCLLLGILWPQTNKLLRCFF